MDQTSGHPLALSVINDSAHCAHRSKNFGTMTKRAFSAYILQLVNAQAKHEARAFGKKYKPRDIDAALADVIDHHEREAADEAAYQAENARMALAG